MKTYLKKIVARINLLPLAAYKRLIKRDVIGFCYHVVSDEDLEHIKHIIPGYRSEKLFRQDLEYFASNFKIISYKELIKKREKELKDNDANAIILTFDDSYSQCFTIIRPLLLKRQISAIFFVLTDTIDNKKMFYRNKLSLCTERLAKMNKFQLEQALKSICYAFDKKFTGIEEFLPWIYSLYYPNEYIDRLCELLGVNITNYLKYKKPYLSAAQIKSLCDSGFTIGAHSKSHPHLCLLDENNAEKEIVESCEIIRGITGQANVPFAFPFSGDDLDRHFLKRLIDKYAFIDFFFDVNGLIKDMDFIINRVCIDSSDEMIENAIKNAYKCFIVNNCFRYNKGLPWQKSIVRQ